MAERLDVWIDRRYALVAGALALAAVVLAALARSHTTFPLDGATMGWAQALGDAYAPVAGLTNEHDHAIAFVAAIVGGSIAARRHVKLALIFVLAAAARPLLVALKAAVDRPRPDGEIAILDVVSDSSFPSGHVMAAVLVFGVWFALASEILPRRLVWPARAAALAAIALYAFARMWASVHWLSDVCGALVWGALAIAVLIALRPALRRACHAGSDLLRPRRAPAPAHLHRLEAPVVADEEPQRAA